MRQVVAVSGVEAYLKLLAFFVLGTVAYVLPRRDVTLRFAPRLWLLSMFGFAQCVHALLAMARVRSADPASSLLLLDAVSLAVGYLSLLEFGRSVYGALPFARPLRAWPGLVAASLATGVAAWFAQMPYVGFVVGARCFIGLPGALLTGVSLLRTAHGHPPRHRAMSSASRTAGAAFVLYGVVMPVSALRDPRLPQWLPTEDDFLSATGVSVSLVRALCALTISAVFVTLVRQANAISHSDQLRHERDFATSLIATAPVIILLLDPDGRIKHINTYGAELLGHASHELLGELWVENFVPQHEQARIQALFETASLGVQTRGNVNAIVTRSGELREIEWNDQLLRDSRGQVTGLLAVGLDITERKRSLEALRASQKQLRDILDAMFAFVGLFSIDGQLIEVNRAPLMAAGVDRDLAVGRSVWDALASCAPPNVEQQARDAFQRAAAGERVRRDLPLKLGADKLMIVDAAFGPVRDESGRIQSVVGSAVDVTEQRELERQRLQLEAQLRQSQKLEALGTLAGGIAHDFNNVLMTIFGNAELARGAVTEPACVSESLAEIEKAARRAQDLVQRILAFSRRQEHSLKPISVRPVIEEVLKLLRATLPARVVLQLRTRGEDLAVMADASQVHQVIMNLMTNAWHALGDRAGRVTVDISSETIEREHMRTDLPPGQYVRIDVSDTGRGISAAILERIFEPFFTTKPAGQGTGLGLSVAHGIMKAHRGAISVESKPDEGTTFHVLFPAAQAGFPGDEPGAAAAGPARGAGEHVLYVDDELALIEIAARMLRSAGYRVTTQTSGEQALSVFRANPRDFDVVVTDHNMPGMSGIELTQEIAALSPHTPVILVSGFLREDELKRTLDLGVAEVVMKPTTYEHLAALIRAMLDRAPAKTRSEVA